MYQIQVSKETNEDVAFLKQNVGGNILTERRKIWIFALSLCLCIFFLITVVTLTLITYNRNKEYTQNDLCTIKKRAKRIINGNIAKPNSYPWIVSLKYGRNSMDHFCGGSIISDQWILTAGHCFNQFQDLDLEYLDKIHVVTGLHYINSYNNRQIYKVIKIITPYNQSDLSKNDIALLKLDRKIEFDSTKSIIDISETESSKLLNKCLFTAGWGSNSTSFTHIFPNELQETNVKIIDEEKCFINIGKISNVWEKNHVFCTESAEISPASLPCIGDSGGPLMSYDRIKNKWFLEGVTSYIVSEPSNLLFIKCLPDQTAFFTKVFNFRDYILLKIAEN